MIYSTIAKKEKKLNTSKKGLQKKEEKKSRSLIGYLCVWIKSDFNSVKKRNILAEGELQPNATVIQMYKSM